MHAVRLAALLACLFAVSGSMAAPFPSSGAISARVAAGSGTVPYQEYSNKAKCPIASTCLLTFPAIAKSGVFVQRVSCVFGITTGGSLTFALLTIQEQPAFNTLSPNKAYAADRAEIYTEDGSTNLFVDVGQRPEISVSSSGTAVNELTCTLSGIHI